MLNGCPRGSRPFGRSDNRRQRQERMSSNGTLLHGCAGMPAPEVRPDKRRLGLFGLFAEVIDVGDGKARMGIVNGTVSRWSFGL